MTTETKPLHLHKMVVKNFMSIRCLEIDAKGHPVEISGKNGAGKSNSLQALWWGLKSASVRELPQPIRIGAEKAEVTLDFGQILISRVVSDAGMRLVVTDSSGAKINKPQEYINGMLAEAFVNPASFLSLRPIDQIDQVLNLCGVKPPEEQVEALTGERHPARSGESADTYLMRLSADDSGTYYVRRREAHRQVEQKRPALDEQRAAVRQLGGLPKAEDREQSPSELVEAIQVEQQKADERRALEETARAARDEHIRAANQLGALEGDRGRHVEAIVALREKIAALNADIKRHELDIDTIDGRIQKGRDVVQELEAERAAADQAFAACPDPSQRIAALCRDLQTIENTNRQQGKRRLAAEQLERLGQEAETAKVEHDRLDVVLTGLRSLRAHLLDGVDLGVDGLEIGEGELRLGGVPFRQASQAQRTRAACAISMRQRPKIRLLLIDEGEKFDQASRAILHEMARERDYQPFIATVSEDSELTIDILGAAA